MKTYSLVLGARLLALVLVGMGGLACSISSHTLPGGGTSPSVLCPQPRDESGCTPDLKVPQSDCTIYEENKDWLPPGYVINATCVCELIPDEPTAICARGKIEAQTAAMPESLREEGRRCNSIQDELERDECFEKYLTPAIYQIHVNAYTECCCPCGPSPYETWKVITVSGTKDCKVGNELFDLTGSCHGTPGKW